ncbi:hypothetical protein SCYAM73S_03414 [Streptomyces cyaneofuscatus]
MQLLGTPGAARPWRVGWSTRCGRAGLAAVVWRRAAELAVAMSGSAERGAHVVDPRTGRSAVTDLLSVTVVAPRLTWADCWATAAFAMGAREGLRWLESLEGVEALLITAGDEVRCTGGLAGVVGVTGAESRPVLSEVPALSIRVGGAPLQSPWLQPPGGRGAPARTATTWPQSADLRTASFSCRPPGPAAADDPPTPAAPGSRPLISISASSPAMVPRMSCSSAWSIAEARNWAAPGSVRRTTRVRRASAEISSSAESLRIRSSLADPPSGARGARIRPRPAPRRSARRRCCGSSPRPARPGPGRASPG